MSKKSKSANKRLTVHRAICKDDQFKGKWRSDVEDAYADAKKHRKEPGNRLHKIKIITKQTISRKFKE